jgi:hypothetical protein
VDVRRRTARWAAALLCALVIGATGACHRPPAATTRSYYMANNGTATATRLGCANGVKSGRATLFFGAPTIGRGWYGATAWGRPNMHMWDIEQTTMNVIRGYASCRRSSSYRLLVGMGTSNSGIDSRSVAWLQAHGRAWATSVRNVAAWANRYYPGVAQVYGAWDFEPSWSSYRSAHAWMQGYDTRPGRQLMFINSSADGCSTTNANNGPCNNGWNQQRVWHLAWQHDPSLPIPQIYTNSGTQARQWKLIDLWATVNARDGIFFYGTLTQLGACRQVGGCAATDNSPHQAHDQLLWWLRSDRRTSQSSLSTMTDVRWNS